jgi:hypothetical protein
MVILVYSVAFALPIYLLYAIHSRPWYLHGLAIVAALVLGIVEMPPEWKGVAFDLAFGGVIVFLLVWGLGGLYPAHRHHHEKHA